MIDNKDNGSMTNTGTKSTSIILSCWAADQLIKNYIECLLDAKIVSNCTLVVADFPASHKNPKYVHDELHRYPDIIYLEQSIPLSLYGAWNIAIKNSKTEFVSNLNLDDRVSPDYYAFGSKELRKNSADVFSTAAIMTGTIGSWTGEGTRRQEHLSKDHSHGQRIVPYGLEYMVYALHGQPKKRNPPHCAPIWRRDLHDKFGWFDCNRFDFCADFEFWLRTVAGGAKLIYSNETKTLFYASNGTASDKLIHSSNESIVSRWKHTFPPSGYKETHLGRIHDKLHHCLNANVIFSNRAYFWHLVDEMVSVVVTAHGDAPFLSDCLRSIASQDYSLLDVIIVLDEVSAEVRNAARNWKEKDKRFRVIESKQRVERNYARNIGLELAVGKWVCIVDGDDELPANSISARVKVSRDHDDAIVYGGLEIFADGKTLSYNRGRQSFSLADMRLGWPSHCSLLIPRSLLEENDLRYPASPSNPHSEPADIAGEDVDFMIRLVRTVEGQVLYNCDEPVYKYRRHASSSYVNRHRSIANVISVLLRHFTLDDESDAGFKKSLLQRALDLVYWSAANGVSAVDVSNDLAKIFTICKAQIADQLVSNAFVQFRESYANVSSRNLLSDNRFLHLLQSNFAELDLNVPMLPAPVIADLSKPLSSKPAIQQHHESVIAGSKQSDNSVVDTKPTRISRPSISMPYGRLLRFKNRHLGGECIILCNGPSLKLVDFSRIDRQRFKIFGLNKIYLGFKTLNVTPDYIAAINKKVIDQSIGEFKSLPIVKFISNRADSGLLSEDPMLFYMNTANQPPQAPRFSFDIVRYVNEGWTVTHAALQIAFYMGFKNVYIVGMDHRFSQHVPGSENKASRIDGDDVDHFHPSYFGNGQEWDLPDLKNSEISYRAARIAYENDDRSIIDCTINGACNIFLKRDISCLYTTSRDVLS